MDVENHFKSLIILLASVTIYDYASIFYAPNILCANILCAKHFMRTTDAAPIHSSEDKTFHFYLNNFVHPFFAAYVVL